MSLATAPARFAGTCNRCGSCCAPVVNGRLLRCEHLALAQVIGMPEATRCTVYRHRVDGMAVQLVDVLTGRVMAESTCGKDSAAEDESIETFGQGRGCSLVPVSVNAMTAGGQQ